MVSNDSSTRQACPILSFLSIVHALAVLLPRAIWSFFLPDAVHVVVQPSRQITIAKVVRRPSRQTQEKNNQRIDNYHPRSKTQNVQFLGVERRQSCLQKVRSEKYTCYLINTKAAPSVFIFYH